MEKNSEIIIGNGSGRKFSKLNIRRIITVAVAIIIIGAGGYGVYNQTTAKQVVDQPEVTEASRRQTLMQESQDIGAELTDEVNTALAAGSAAQIEQIYDAKIAAQPGNANAQAFLYLKKALDLRSAGASDEKVFEAALQAEMLDTEKIYAFDIYPLLGYTAYKLGQKQETIDYLKKALTVFKNMEYVEANLIEETENFIRQTEEEL